MLTAILLTTFAVAADPDSVLEPAATFVAPAVRPIPEELRELAERMPDDGRWVRDSGKEGPLPVEGAFFHAPLDKHIMERLRILDLYPNLSQTKIDEARKVHDAEVSAARKVAEAECKIKRIDDRVAVIKEGVPRWVAVLIGAGGIGLGALGALLMSM